MNKVKATIRNCSDAGVGLCIHKMSPKLAFIQHSVALKLGHGYRIFFVGDGKASSPSSYIFHLLCQFSTASVCPITAPFSSDVARISD